MTQYQISTEEQFIDGEYITIHSVVDSDGYPINDGHFTDSADAQYVCDKMGTDEIHGDNVSNLSQSQRSYIRV